MSGNTSLIVSAMAFVAVAGITHTPVPIGWQLVVCVAALIVVATETFSVDDAEDADGDDISDETDAS